MNSYIILLFAFVLMTFNCLWCFYQWRVFANKYFKLVDKVADICELLHDTISSIKDILLNVH